MKSTVFLFGEAEKGEFGVPLICGSVSELCDLLGNPPERSLGIFYAVQTLMYRRSLLFFRVREEGFSVKDYMQGFKLLQTEQRIPPLEAIIIPGVGDKEIVEVASEVCNLRNSLLVFTEQDLYDYLTDGRAAL